jgi:hypothetical protein
VVSVAERRLWVCRGTDLGGRLLFEVTEDRVSANASGHLGVAVLGGCLIWLGALRKTEVQASGVDGFADAACCGDEEVANGSAFEIKNVK